MDSTLAVRSRSLLVFPRTALVVALGRKTTSTRRWRLSTLLLIAVLLGAALYGAHLYRASNAAAATALRNDRTLPEALIAERMPTPNEIRTLQQALGAYRRGGEAEAVAPIVEYVTQHRDSPWRVSLQTNLGLVYYQNGYFSKALQAWHLAWEQGKR